MFSVTSHVSGLLLRTESLNSNIITEKQVIEKTIYQHEDKSETDKVRHPLP